MGPCAPALTAMQPAMPMLPQAPLQLAAPFAAFSSNAPDVRKKKKRTTSSSSSTSSSTSTKELRRKLRRKEKKSRKHSSPAPLHKHHRQPASRKRRGRASTPRGRSHSPRAHGRKKSGQVSASQSLGRPRGRQSAHATITVPATMARHAPPLDCTASAVAAILLRIWSSHRDLRHPAPSFPAPFGHPPSTPQPAPWTLYNC